MVKRAGCHALSKDRQLAIAVCTTEGHFRLNTVKPKVQSLLSRADRPRAARDGLHWGRHVDAARRISESAAPRAERP